ncbi:hypothetical protein GCM10007079_11660 [Nocardiopsis terrae]|nr:hypothetical protein GCM10007079_11660 [Nocardiopsis terrae]
MTGVGTASAARPNHGDLATRGNFGAEIAPGSKITAKGGRTCQGGLGTLPRPLPSGRIRTSFPP